MSALVIVSVMWFLSFLTNIYLTYLLYSLATKQDHEGPAGLVKLPPRLLKPFAKKSLIRKPKINDDTYAWKVEQGIERGE